MVTPTAVEMTGLRLAGIGTTAQEIYLLSQFLMGGEHQLSEESWLMNWVCMT
jgi:hypothetical protein